MFDTLIKDGLLYRGDGNTPILADVGIQGDTIVSIAPNLNIHANRIINASGKCVCPGFIDIHSHSELTLMMNPQGQSKLLQGVTTEVVGNCGLTAFPLVPGRRESLAFIDVPGLVWDWQDTDTYLERLRRVNPALNIAQLAGHGGIRAAVMGYDNRTATTMELAQMQYILADMFEKGIFGLSTGLGYAPDFYSNEDELCALAEVVKSFDRVFSIHVRGERKTLFKAVAEAINISRRTGANVEISHLKCSDAMNIGLMPELLKLFDQAAEEGLPVNFDHYPYTAGCAYLGLVFPPWAHEGGMASLLQRLADPPIRHRLEMDMMDGSGEWSSFLASFQGRNLLIADANCPDKAKWIGKRLSEIAKEMSCSVACAACELMLEAEGKVDMVMFQQDETDLEAAMRHPMGMFASDGFAMDLGKKIRKGTPHPRSFGTFPRVISRYVRERNVLSLEEAIRRMTSAPASKMRLRDRGLLEYGYKADIVVFDYQKIKDNATYENPFQYPSGIDWVLVNGELAKSPQSITGNFGGKLLLRKEEVK